MLHFLKILLASRANYPQYSQTNLGHSTHMKNCVSCTSMTTTRINPQTIFLGNVVNKEHVLTSILTSTTICLCVGCKLSEMMLLLQTKLVTGNCESEQYSCFVDYCHLCIHDVIKTVLESYMCFYTCDLRKRFWCIERVFGKAF